MNRKFVLRYLILITVLAICAGAAWCLADMSGTHAADAVLARMGNDLKRTGQEAGLWLQRRFI